MVWGDLVCTDCWYANAQVDVHSAFYFLGRSFRNFLTFLQCLKVWFGRLLCVLISEDKMLYRVFVFLALNIWSTKMPGRWIWSGSSDPTGTIYSTSTIHFLPAIAMSGLKFLAALWKITLPFASPFYPLTNAQSPLIDSS